MKKTRKVLALLCSAILLVAIAVGATVAYLTDTKTVTNTFTVGNVQIKLDEATATYNKITNTWEAGSERNEKGQQYKLLPGTVVEKDPTITVLAGNEECYVRALITVAYQQAVDADPMAEDMMTWINHESATNWDWVNAKIIETVKDDTAKTVTRTYELRYNETVKAAASDTKLASIFSKITIPSNLTNEQIGKLNGFSVVVKAEAIQADGFADADAAWNKFPA